MLKNKHTQKGAAMTELVLETFRLNGRLLASGDKLVEPFGLSSARWQVLGAIHFAETPTTGSMAGAQHGAFATGRSTDSQ